MALPMLTATEMASELAERTGVSKTDVRHVLDELHNVVIEQLGFCQRVKIANIVQLEPKIKAKRKARIGRNPATGEDVKIAAKPAEAVVRARVLKPGKDAAPSLPKLRRALS
jgi:DNA-binding protein HU-beta